MYNCQTMKVSNKKKKISETRTADSIYLNKYSTVEITV